VKSGLAEQLLEMLRQNFYQFNRDMSVIVVLLIKYTLPALLALHGNTLQA